MEYHEKVISCFSKVQKKGFAQLYVAESIYIRSQTPPYTIKKKTFR